MSRLPMRCAFWLLVCLLPGLAGCGTTKTTSATDQLLLSNAVDRSVSSIDFGPLAGQTVYLDTEYIKRNGSIPGAPATGYVNTDYLISSLRQQMMAAGCLLQEKKEDAAYVVEARVGVLGSDGHEVTYGLPANNLLSTAASFVPGSPSLPTIPEIALAKRNDTLAAAKIGVFAYDRATREAVWQSGLAAAHSSARATWVLGAGPFQQGEIYQGVEFAGMRLSSLLSGEDAKRTRINAALAEYKRPALFAPAGGPEEPAAVHADAENAAPADGVQPASAEKPSPPKPAK